MTIRAKRTHRASRGPSCLPPALNSVRMLLMPLNHRLCRWLAGALIVAILSMQIATAAYVCPMNSGQTVTQSSATVDMPCAGTMAPGIAIDPAQPGLCLQHCLFGKSQAPADSEKSFPSAPELVLTFVLDALDTSMDERVGFAQHLRTRDRAPPLLHSILHCCYRI